MDDTRLSKGIVCARELQSRKRPPHKARKHFKDVVKQNLKDLKVAHNDWETLAENQSAWRNMEKQQLDTVPYHRQH